MSINSARGNLPQCDLKDVLTFSHQSLRKFSSSRILISGATGFVGTWLTSSLLQANEEMNLGLEVVIITRDSTLAKKRLSIQSNDPVRIVVGDLASGENPLAKLHHEFTHIVHLATPTFESTGSLDKAKSYASTVEGARNLVKFAAEIEVPPVLLHSSSGAVYGKQPMTLERISEGWANDNLEGEISSYGRAKLETENIILRASSEGIIRAANPRLFAFLGPHLAMDAHFAVGNFIRDALHGRDIQVLGNPHTRRSYLYPTDLTEWLLAILAEPHEEVVHVGSRIPIEMSSLAETIAETFRSPGISYLGAGVPPSNYVPEITTAQKLYGVAQRVDLGEGIRRWLKWLQS